MKTQAEVNAVVIECAKARNTKQTLTDKQWKEGVMALLPNLSEAFITTVLREAKRLRYKSYGWTLE